MGKPPSLKEARELALEVEREYVCSMIDEDVKDENKIKTSRENKRVNIVNQDVEQITCAYCKRVILMGKADWIQIILTGKTDQVKIMGRIMGKIFCQEIF